MPDFIEAKIFDGWYLSGAVDELKLLEDPKLENVLFELAVERPVGCGGMKDGREGDEKDELFPRVPPGAKPVGSEDFRAIRQVTEN